MDDLSDMYNSRTFCLYEDIEKLKSLNLAKGGSLENEIVKYSPLFSFVKILSDIVLMSDAIRNAA